MLDNFTKQYIVTALWSENDGDEPLDRNHGIGDIDPECFCKMISDCLAFQGQHSGLIEDDPSLAGHDFWLTRNGHGAGFWDGDWPEGTAEVLTEASEQFGTCEPYVGDDGKIYLT